MLSAAEEATRQSLSPLVAVRRLWPGPRWMPNYEPGALVHLPPADAQGLIAAGDAFRILPPPQPDNTAKPLHLLIRDRLGTDPELAGLTTTARRYASRGLPHCPEAPARLRLMLPPMQIRLVPATFVINGEAPAAGWYAESYLPQSAMRAIASSRCWRSASAAFGSRSSPPSSMICARASGRRAACCRTASASMFRRKSGRRHW